MVLCVSVGIGGALQLLMTEVEMLEMRMSSKVQDVFHCSVVSWLLVSKISVSSAILVEFVSKNYV